MLEMRKDADWFEIILNIIQAIGASWMLDQLLR